KDDLSLSDAREQCRLVLFQGRDFFLIFFFALVESGESGIYLTEELLAFGIEFVAAEPLELELVIQCVGAGLEVGFALLYSFLQNGDGFFLVLYLLEFVAG